MFRKLATFTMILSSLALAACGDDSPTAPDLGSGPGNTGFQGPYALSEWENTGIAAGTTSVGPGDDVVQQARFGYEVDLGDRSGLGSSDRHVMFSTEAAASGSAQGPRLIP